MIASAGTALSTAAMTVAALMVATWLLSLALKNASIVDIAWGLGFVAVAWSVRFAVDGVTARQNLLVALTSVWGLRLGGYLFIRNHGKGEDFRYRAMRKHWGPKFPIISLLTVFTLQGVLMYVVSLGVQLGQAATSPSLGVLAWVGVAVWVVGLTFEAVGDWQLAAFKRDPANQGKVMDRGLWRYTRHPNYFGDFCVWWGLFLVAAEAPVAWWGIVGPALMSFLLLRVSGVAMLEKTIGKRRPGYEEYVRRTSAFFPRPPKELT